MFDLIIKKWMPKDQQKTHNETQDGTQDGTGTEQRSFGNAVEDLAYSTPFDNEILDSSRVAVDEEMSIDDSAFGSDDILRIDFIHALPFELAVQILSYIDPTSSCSLVSKRWNLVCSDNSVWRQYYYRKFGMLASEMVKTIPPAPRYHDWREIFGKKKQLLQNWQEGQVDALFLEGHTDAVYCLQFDAKKIISGSRDRSIKIWDLTSKECINTLIGHTGSVLCLQYNDQHIISGSSDATIRIWNVKTGECCSVLHGHAQPVLDIQFYGRDHIVSCSKDMTLRVWNLHTGTVLRTIHGHTAAVNSIHVHGGLVASASGDSTVRIWEIETGALVRILKGHERGLACVQFDGDRVVSGSNDKTIKIWSANSGECLNTLPDHNGLVRTLAFDRDHLVSGSYDQTIKVWNPTTGQLVLDMGQVHRSWVFHVQIDAVKIISSSQDFRIIIWDFSNGADYTDFV